MRILALTLLLFGLCPVSVRALTPAESLALCPAPFNTIAFVNVDAILRTPRAVAEKWSEREHTEYLAGAIPFHPSVMTIVSAAEIRPGSRERNASEGEMVMRLRKPLDLATVAKVVGGQQVTIGGDSAVLTPRGMYLVKLGDVALGAMKTDNRQEVSRWIESVRERTLPSPRRYLRNALATPGANQILIAFDTADMFAPNEADIAVSISPAVEKDQPRARLVSRYLSGLRGVRMFANVAESTIRLSIIFDGENPPGVPAELLKDVVVEIIERSGASLTNLRGATATTDGLAFTLSLTITDEELAHITSLVLPPAPPATDYDIVIAPSGVTSAATQRYIQAADRIVAALRTRYEKARDYNRTALWHETSAKQLVALSAINVEPKVVEHVHTTAAYLAEIANSLRGVPIKAAALENNAYIYAFHQPFFGWGWNNIGINSNIGQIRQQQQAAIDADKENRARLWSKINRQRNDLNQILRSIR